MADENNNTYLYIDEEIDPEVFAANLRHNARSYAESHGWDAQQIEAFYNSLNDYLDALDQGRLSSDMSGAIYDSAGLLANSPVSYTLRNGKGKIVDQQGYNDLNARRRKKAVAGFTPNQEVANYWDKIARSLTKEKKPEEKTKFSFSTNGLWNSFMRYLAPNGVPNLNAWIEKDPFNEETGKRELTNRKAIVADYIDRYIDDLADEIDFSDVGTNWTRESYVKQLRDLQSALRSGSISDNDLYLLLDQIGSSSESYLPYFTRDKEYGKPADTESEDVKKLRAAVQAEMDSKRSAWMSGNAPMYQAMSQKKVPLPSGLSGEAAQESYLNNLNNMSTSGRTLLSLDPQKLMSSDGKEWAQYIDQFNEIFPDHFQEVTGNGRYQGWRVFLDSYNKNNGTAIVYDPISHYIGRVFIANLDRTFYDRYWNDLTDAIRYSLDSNGNPAWQKRGGVLSMQTGGTASAAAQAGMTDEEYEQYVNAYLAQLAAQESSSSSYGASSGAASGASPYESQETDKYASVYRGSERMSASPVTAGGAGSLEQIRRTLAEQSGSSYGNTPAEYILRGEGSEYNSNYQLSGADRTRLASMAADIYSMLSPDGVTSAIAAFGSDLANLGADLSDDYVTTGQALGNFGLNAAMSAIAFVPVIGGAGKAGRLVKTATKLAKPLAYAAVGMGAFDLISNGGEVAQSLNKLLKKSDGTVESKMTMSDWRNIYVLVSTLIGGANIHKTRRAKKVSEKVGMTGDELVQVKATTGTGDSAITTDSVLHLTGDQAKAFRSARESGNVEAAKSVIAGVHNPDAPDMKFELATTTGKDKWLGIIPHGEAREQIDFKEISAPYVDPVKLRRASKNYSGFTRKVLRNPYDYAELTGVYRGDAIMGRTRPTHEGRDRTETPVTETPVTETPVTETPVTETPVTETPVTETPVTETPVTETPVTETPVTETPVTETPVTETPVTEIPVTEKTGGEGTEKGSSPGEKVREATRKAGGSKKRSVPRLLKSTVSKFDAAEKDPKMADHILVKAARDKFRKEMLKTSASEELVYSEPKTMMLGDLPGEEVVSIETTPETWRTYKDYSKYVKEHGFTAEALELAKSYGLSEREMFSAGLLQKGGMIDTRPDRLKINSARRIYASLQNGGLLKKKSF